MHIEIVFPFTKTYAYFTHLNIVNKILINKRINVFAVSIRINYFPPNRFSFSSNIDNVSPSIEIYFPFSLSFPFQVITLYQINFHFHNFLL